MQLQAPPLHVWPVAQGPHALPAAPHAETVWAAVATHVPPLQQPVGQEVASQTHAPDALHS